MTKTLDPAAYWKLRALCTDTLRCDDIARQAKAKQIAALRALDLDADTFSLDDDALTITIPDEAARP